MVKVLSHNLCHPCQYSGPEPVHNFVPAFKYAVRDLSLDKPDRSYYRPYIFEMMHCFFIEIALKNGILHFIFDYCVEE